MKCQSLFCGKNKKIIISLSSAESDKGQSASFSAVKKETVKINRATSVAGTLVGNFRELSGTF